MLPAMAEGGGWVNAGVMVGVVAATMAEGEGLTQKRERRIIIILYNLSYYPIISQHKS